MRTIWRVIGVLAVLLVLFFLLMSSAVVRAGNALLDSAGSSTVYGATVANSAPAQSEDQSLPIHVTGLKPQTLYAITLDENSCGGAVLETYSSIQSDANGAINRILSVTHIFSGSSLWVDVHQGNDIHGTTQVCQQGAIVVAATPTATPTPIPTATPQPTPTPVPIPIIGFPVTGVAPAPGSSYTNYTYPLKH